MNNNRNHKNMGEEFMDDLGSSINDAMKIARATGLDKQMDKDIKNLKGYTDSEIASMDLQELESAKKQSKKMLICGVMFAVANIAKGHTIINSSQTAKSGGFIILSHFKILFVRKWLFK